MESISYNSVDGDLLIGLGGALNRDAWASVTGGLSIQDTAPALIKKVVQDAVAAYQESLDGTYNGAKDENDDWDDAQTELAFAINRAAKRRDPAKRAHAALLKRDLLMGQGTAQTRLTYAAQVAFGHRQLALASQDAYKDAVDALGLGAHIAAVKKTTEALEHAIGLDGSGAALSRGERISAALRELRLTAAWAHESLIVLSTKCNSNKDKEHAAALLAPFAALQQH
jgi:hypothetical protein